MKTATFQVPVSLDQTLPSPGDATYQTEQLALILNNTIKELDDEGFEFATAESSDFSSYGTDLKTFIDNMHEREEDILLTGATTVVANLPDVLPIIGAILSGGTAAIPSILLNAVVSQLFRSRDTSVESFGGEIINGDIDLSALTTAVQGLNSSHAELVGRVEELVRAFVIPENGAEAENFIDMMKLALLTEDGDYSRLEGILTEFTVNLIGDLFESHWKVGPDIPES